MVDCGKFIWKNGHFVPNGDGANVPFLTHSLHYGVGVFEGIRAYQRADGTTCLFRLDDHVRRLMDSCRLVHLLPQVTATDLHDASVELLRRQGWSDAYLRPLVFLGAGAMGLFPADNPVETWLVSWQWGTYLGGDALERGIRVTISSHSRHHVRSALARAKVCGHYVTSVLAKQEAKARGFDEALLLDTDGFVAEGSGENVFVVRQGELVTPPLSGSILAGITRDTVIRLALEEGIVVREERLLRDDLYLADEVFLTGTAAEVTPVVHVDDRVIATGTPGAVTKRLQARYFDIVRGSDDQHDHWLTPVLKAESAGFSGSGSPTGTARPGPRKTKESTDEAKSREAS